MGFFLSFILFVLIGKSFSKTLFEYQRDRYYEHVSEVDEKVFSAHERERDTHPPFTKPVYHPFESDSHLRRYASRRDPFGFDHSDMKSLTELYEKKRSGSYPEKDSNERRTILDEDAHRYSKNVELEEVMSQAKTSLHIDAHVHKGSFNLDFLERQYSPEFSVLSCDPIRMKLKVMKNTFSYDTFVEFFIPGSRFSSTNCGEEVVTYSLIEHREIHSEDDESITLIFTTQPLSLKEFFMSLKINFKNDNGKGYKDFMKEEEPSSSSSSEVVNVEDSESFDDSGNERRFFDTSGVWDLTLPVYKYDWNYLNGKKVKEYDIFKDEFHTSDGDAIANCFNCYVHFDSGVYLRLEYSFIDVDRFNAEFFGEFKGALGIIFNFTGNYVLDINLYEKRHILKTIHFSIYGFPVIIQICFDRVDLKLHLDATGLNIGIMEQFLLEADVKFGYLYDEESDEEHSVYSEFEYLYDISSPQIIMGSGVVKLRASIIPQFVVLVETACPISFSPVPYVEFELLINRKNRTAELTPYWGIDLIIGVKPLEFFGKTFTLNNALPWDTTFTLWKRTEISPCPWCVKVGGAVSNFIRFVDYFNNLTLGLSGHFEYNDGERFLRSGETKTVKFYHKKNASETAIKFRFLQRNADTSGGQSFKFHVNVRQHDMLCPYTIIISDGPDTVVVDEAVGADEKDKVFTIPSAQLSSPNTYLEFIQYLDPPSSSSSDFCAIDLNVYVSFDGFGSGVDSIISDNEMLLYDLIDLAEQYVQLSCSDFDFGMIFFGEDGGIPDVGQMLKFADRSNFRYLTSSPTLGMNTEQFESAFIGLYSPYNQTFHISIEPLLPCDISVKFEYTDEKLNERGTGLNLLDIQFNGINVSLQLPPDCLGQDFNSQVFQEWDILQVFLDHFEGGGIWEQMLSVFVDTVTPLLQTEDDDLGASFGELEKYISYAPNIVEFLFPPVGEHLIYSENEAISEDIKLISPLPSAMFVSGDDRNGVAPGSGELSIQSEYCMNSCNHKGVCFLKRCRCFPGYTGRQCEVSLGIGDAVPTIVLSSVLLCWCCAFCCCCLIIVFCCCPCVERIAISECWNFTKSLFFKSSSSKKDGKNEQKVRDELFEMFNMKEKLLVQPSDQKGDLRTNENGDEDGNELHMAPVDHVEEFEEDSFMDVIDTTVTTPAVHSVVGGNSQSINSLSGDNVVIRRKKGHSKRRNNTVDEGSVEKFEEKDSVHDDDNENVEVSQEEVFQESDFQQLGPLAQPQQVEYPKRRKTWDEILQEMEEAKKTRGENERLSESIDQ